MRLAIGPVSGSNIAVFSLGRLRLEAAAAAGDKSASVALELRRDANLMLVTMGHLISTR